MAGSGVVATGGVVVVVEVMLTGFTLSVPVKGSRSRDVVVGVVTVVVVGVVEVVVGVVWTLMMPVKGEGEVVELVGGVSEDVSVKVTKTVPVNGAREVEVDVLVVVISVPGPWEVLASSAPVNGESEVEVEVVAPSPDGVSDSVTWTSPVNAEGEVGVDVDVVVVGLVWPTAGSVCDSVTGRTPPNTLDDGADVVPGTSLTGPVKVES